MVDMLTTDPAQDLQEQEQKFLEWAEVFKITFSSAQERVGLPPTDSDAKHAALPCPTLIATLSMRVTMLPSGQGLSSIQTQHDEGVRD